MVCLGIDSRFLNFKLLSEIGRPDIGGDLVPPFLKNVV
jgi:hypothetical protein